MSYVGAYPPASYLLPGLLARTASDPISGLYRARVGSAATSLLLLGAALALVARRGEGAGPLAGLVVAVTPMVVFLFSTLSPSALEVAGGLALGVAVLDLASDERPSPWIWAVLALGGGALAVSRTLGLLWLAGYLVLLALLSGPRRITRLIRGSGWPAFASIGVVVVSALLGAIWDLTMSRFARQLFSEMKEALGPSVRMVPEALLHQVGVFGWLDTRMPLIAYAVWAVLLSALVMGALRLSGPRLRLALVVSAIGLVVVPAVVAVRIGAAIWGPGHMQGRWVLAFSVVVPLTAGYALKNRRWPVWLVPVAALVHAVAWYVNARRYAVGIHGPLWFPGHSLWTPPGGWLGPSVLMLLGTSGMMAVWVMMGSRRAAAVRPSTSEESHA